MKIGAFTIGGGYAMIPLIKNELDRRKWIGEDELPDIIALAQSAPGILAVNVSIFTGYKIRGIKGSIAATFGSVLPSFLIILAIAMAFTNFQDNPVVIRIFKGIRPVVVSLIAAPMISMAKKANNTWWSWLITIVSLLLVSFLEVSPIYIILVMIVLGFTFGGGYAMLSLIQGQVVTGHQWITQSTFTDIVAISQMTPGPIGINCATYVGYDVVAGATGSHFLGIIGSFTATLALVLPSFIIVLALVKFYMKFHSNSIFEDTMSWIRPSVVGLIGAAAVIMMFDASWSGLPLLSDFKINVIDENFPDWKSWALFGAGLLASLLFKIGPITIIIAGGVLGFLLY